MFEFQFSFSWKLKIENLKCIFVFQFSRKTVGTRVHALSTLSSSITQQRQSRSQSPLVFWSAPTKTRVQDPCLGADQKTRGFWERDCNSISAVISRAVFRAASQLTERLEEAILTSSKAFYC